MACRRRLTPTEAQIARDLGAHAAEHIATGTDSVVYKLTRPDTERATCLKLYREHITKEQLEEYADVLRRADDTLRGQDSEG